MAVNTLPELKVSDLMREYKSSFVDTWKNLIRQQRSLRQEPCFVTRKSISSRLPSTLIPDALLLCTKAGPGLKDDPIQRQIEVFVLKCASVIASDCSIKALDNVRWPQVRACRCRSGQGYSLY
jgi:hypothetical protein